jgi:hypothetical protein
LIATPWVFSNTPKGGRMRLQRFEWIDADQDQRAAAVRVHPEAVIALARTISVGWRL